MNSVCFDTNTQLPHFSAALLRSQVFKSKSLQVTRYSLHRLSLHPGFPTSNSLLTNFCCFTTNSHMCTFSLSLFQPGAESNPDTLPVSLRAGGMQGSTALFSYQFPNKYKDPTSNVLSSSG